ncbi:MAG: hypothetical protein AB1633_01860, partial [Elusimicrobiota bacterium]
EINIVEKSNGELKNEKVQDIFDKWLVDSMKIAKEKNAVFMVDDFRLLRYLSSENIRGCNTIIVLKYMITKNWIDSKIYSTSLGDLAERCYTFLSFTGDDLFQIVMEDNSKITLRTYHLINQLLLPGSVVSSFTNVFVKFIDLLWRTGSLPEDKIKWLKFLTERVLEFIDNQGGVQTEEELTRIGADFTQMWGIAIDRSNRDELTLIEKSIGEILKQPYLYNFKEGISKLIEKKKIK